MKIQLELNEEELRKSYRDNHFEPVMEFFEYQKAYEEVLERVTCEGFFESYSYEEICSLTKVVCEGDGEYILGAVTLGNGLDQYELEANAAEDYSASYRMDCIAMDLLKKAYEEYKELVHLKTGRYMISFQFFGEDLPVTLIPQVLEAMKADSFGITCNEACMMTPKKTVVFLSELTGEKENSGCHICDNCQNWNCSSREK